MTEKQWSQELILEQFFSECLRFWEKELGVSSDESREPFINAIKEIPRTNPYLVGSKEVIDEQVRNNFIKYRLMDCFGTDWKRHISEFPNFDASIL